MNTITRLIRLLDTSETRQRTIRSERGVQTLLENRRKRSSPEIGCESARWSAGSVSLPGPLRSDFLSRLLLRGPAIPPPLFPIFRM